MEVIRVLLDCEFGALLCYCSAEPRRNSVSVVFSIKDEEGKKDPRKMLAKKHLIGILDKEDKNNGISAADEDDCQVAAAFSSVDEFLGFLKRRGFMPAKLKCRTEPI